MSIRRGVAIALLVVTGAWAWLWAMPFVNRVVLLHHRDGYRPATFVVERVRADRDRSDVWADGEVRTESGESWSDRLALGGVVDTDDDPVRIRAVVPPGTTFDVLANPDLPNALIQGETLRVKVATPTFWADEEALLWMIVTRGFAPFALALAWFAIVVVIERRARRRRATDADVAQ